VSREEIIILTDMFREGATFDFKDKNGLIELLDGF
jgi:hypothetical protein